MRYFALPKKVPGFKGGPAFWISADNLWFRAEYDPQLNRVALGVGKDRWFARPNVALAAALRTAKGGLRRKPS